MSHLTPTGGILDHGALSAAAEAHVQTLELRGLQFVFGFLGQEVFLSGVHFN